MVSAILLQYYMWQSQVENEHYSTVSGLVISLEYFVEITPDFHSSIELATRSAHLVVYKSGHC